MDTAAASGGSSCSPEQSRFPPSRFSALRRAVRARPGVYARGRNFLDGPVTALSPYVTHGLLPAAELFDYWHRRRGLTLADKLLAELAWREFYHHVWLHRGDDILDDLGAGLPGVRYARALPEDIRRAATGVPVIDASVARLYATGYLHNHQRMWLASYIVHLRKVHWRVAADWLLGHLLDGDLAANHLSWQWVAGTFSAKPYLFNAANVARYAPGLASPGTVLDRSYPELEHIARHAGDQGPEARRPKPLDEPPLHPTPPHWTSSTTPPAAEGNTLLIHPWSLGARSLGDRCLGVLDAGFHARFPWSRRRWAFVLAGMRRQCGAIVLGDLATLLPALAPATRLRAVATLNPGYRQALAAGVGHLAPLPTALPALERCQRSYSAWRKAILRARPELAGPFPD